MAGAPENSAWLVPLPGGPPLAPIEIKPTPAGVIIGRHEACAVRLPPDADKVSRQHARFAHIDSQWRVADLSSRWGTHVNGVKIPPQRDMPLGDGDLVRIVPWTFSFSTQGIPKKGLYSSDDTSTSMTMIRNVSADHAGALQDDLVTLLLESASAIHAAEDEKSLAAALMDIACRGTGLPNAAILRALDSAGRIEVIASRSGGSQHDRPNATFSRSLLTAASGGSLAEMSGNNNAGAAQASISQSMVQMKIDAAICAPLMLGSTVAAYLYLDSRGNSPGMLRTLRPNASGFCLALAKIAGLALANLKRIVVERRAATMEAELNAAATAQKWILPKGQTRSHSFVCVGDSRAGQYLGGDFFDAMVLPDGRLLVSLGDVSGHGIAASVLMTASQGYLHAALTQHADLARAVTDLNAFIHPRRPESKFITLWIGVFDPKTMTVDYIDAGHGYAMLEKSDGSFEALSGGEGVPVGILADFQYRHTTAKLPAGGRVLIISDGIIEQTEGDPTASPRRQFELEGVQNAIRGFGTDQDVIERLFQAVYKFAGGPTMADDTTAVLVKW